jgi:formylglycine-generating enzyme required for sulfatase activity
MGARGLHNWFLSLLAAVILFTGWAALLLSSAAALADKRMALVVGSDHYPNLGPDRQLLRAVNDAKAVGDALAKIGFSVIRGANLGRQGMIDQLDELTSQLEPGDTVAFFYAGHGVAIGGNNYLIPSDVPSVTPDAEARVRGASIAETDVVAELQARGVRVALLVLDACRDNPFPRSATRAIGNTRGLLDAKPARGVFTIYSAGIGQAALDRLEPNDPSRNSVFTRVFIDELTKPDLDLAGLAIEVREKVAALARQAKGESGQPEPHEQTPAYYDQTIGGRIFLAAPKTAVAAAPVSPAAPCGDGAISVSLSSRPACPLSAAEERALRPKDSFKECAACAEMVVVPAGSFAMGSRMSEPGRSDDEGPQRTVTFKRQFAVGRFAVTFDEWDACVADAGCNGHRPFDEGWGRGRRPVIHVNWNDAQTYLAWISLKTGKGYRLLSEAEREYVTRAGTTTPFWLGSSISLDQANISGPTHTAVRREGFVARPFQWTVSSRTNGGFIKYMEMCGSGLRIVTTRPTQEHRMMVLHGRRAIATIGPFETGPGQTSRLYCVPHSGARLSITRSAATLSVSGSPGRFLALEQRLFLSRKHAKDDRSPL